MLKLTLPNYNPNRICLCIINGYTLAAQILLPKYNIIYNNLNNTTYKYVYYIIIYYYLVRYYYILLFSSLITQ